MKTTLNKIRSYSLTIGGWEKLLNHLGKTRADDEPLSLLTILDSNGLDDALCCLKAVDGHEKEMRLFAVWCARQVEHLVQEDSIEAARVAARAAWAAWAAWAAEDVGSNTAWAAWAAAACGVAGAEAKAAQETELRRLLKQIEEEEKQ